MKRGLSMIVAGTLMLFLVVGCSQNIKSTGTSVQSTTAPSGQQSTTGTESETKVIPPKTAEKTPTAEKSANQMMVKLYYPDKQATDLVELTNHIQWGPQETKYGASFKALFHAPESNLVAVWKEQPFKMKFEDGLLAIDLTEKITAGSTQERFLVTSLLKTMFQFSEVQKVQILIGGKPAETLSGHLDIGQAFTRKSLADL